MFLPAALLLTLVQAICENDCCNTIKSWNHLQDVEIDTASDCCQMEGVVCSGQTVTEIYWNSTNSNGELPQELGLLSGLKTLDLSGNFITGEIPDHYYDLSYLQILRLKQNSLSGQLQSFKNLESLRALDLSKNEFSGELAQDSFEDIPDLTFINFGDNENLSGIFPPLGPQIQLM